MCQGRADERAGKRSAFWWGSGGTDNLGVSPTVRVPPSGGDVRSRSGVGARLARLRGCGSFPQRGAPTGAVESASLPAHYISLEVFVGIFQVEGAREAQPRCAVGSRSGEKEANAIIGRSFLTQLAEDPSVDFFCWSQAHRSGTIQCQTSKCHSSHQRRSSVRQNQSGVERKL